jgi:hypothetical protein
MLEVEVAESEIAAKPLEARISRAWLRTQAVVMARMSARSLSDKRGGSARIGVCASSFSDAVKVFLEARWPVSPVTGTDGFRSNAPRIREYSATAISSATLSV